MTEDQWLVCNKPTQPVMDWLRRRDGSERKFYLTAAAVLRRISVLFPAKRYHNLIQLIERHADGKVSKRELSQAQRRAEDDAFERYHPWQALGVPLRKHPDVAAAIVASHSALSEGFASACNAISETGQTGKRAEIWPWQCAILREIFGNPFRPVTIAPAWLTPTVKQVAEAIYLERAFDRMPILADALEDAGCTNADLLNHCRQPGDHVRGCWVVDLLLGKE